MYPFSNAVTPAVRSHLDAQVAFVNDLSKSLTRSLQQLFELNLQLGQTLLEESHIASHKLLTVDAATDAISIAALRAQPAAEKLRAYQQHLSRVAADAQVEFTRVTEQHIQETSRTARALADEVARAASSETERSIRVQQDTLKNFRDPFQTGASSRGNGNAHAHGNLQSDGASGSVEFDTPAGHVSAQGNLQGAQAGSQQGGKGAGKPA